MLYRTTRYWQAAVIGALLLGVAAAPRAFGTGTLHWSTNQAQARVSADLKGAPVMDVLEQIAEATGWQVFVEPETQHEVNVKFNGLQPGEALRFLLGDVNFALLPETNATPRLYVFRTSRQNATEIVRVAKAPDPRGQPKVIPNELVVRLKPGAKIDDLAKLLGAKVIGRIDGLNAYRLQFEDAAAATAARDQLANNQDVTSVDSNFSIGQPPTPAGLGTGAMVPSLQMKPPPDSGRVILGLVDTAVQPLGHNLDQFLQAQVSVAGAAQLDPNSPTHGTAMAETILASLEAATKGNTSVQILPIDVYGPNQNTTSFDVANGIVQAVNKGAKVINLSLGSPGDNSVLADVIQNALKNNILLVGAAGNQPVTTPFYPAAYQGVNAVTAVDQGQVASYANRGSFVTLGAPGSNIVPFGNLSFGVQGTSVSSAIVSGFAAGYMDFNQATTSRAQTAIDNNFGVKLTTGK